MAYTLKDDDDDYETWKEHSNFSASICIYRLPEWTV